jgi:hypothetical protein
MAIKLARFEVLRNDAGALRQQAAALRRQPTVEQGTVSAVGVDALIDGILADPMRIGPAVDEITSWSGEVGESLSAASHSDRS